ncbi:MAG: hypothetical protein C0514_05800 [Candidatus Puniceispirillum sp.]|nr:hypothetical protein [Candidatus Puniceispirillum sp.]
MFFRAHAVLKAFFVICSLGMVSQSYGSYTPTQFDLDDKSIPPSPFFDTQGWPDPDPFETELLVQSFLTSAPGENSTSGEDRQTPLAPSHDPQIFPDFSALARELPLGGAAPHESVSGTREENARPANEPSLSGKWTRPFKPYVPVKKSNSPQEKMAAISNTGKIHFLPYEVPTPPKRLPAKKIVFHAPMTHESLGGTFIAPAANPAPRNGVARQQKTTRPPHPYLPKAQAIKKLEEGMRLVGTGNPENLDAAFNAFSKCYKRNASMRWDGCLGMAMVYCAKGQIQLSLQSIDSILLSITASEGVKEEALLFRKRIEERLRGEHTDTMARSHLHCNACPPPAIK